MQHCQNVEEKIAIDYSIPHGSINTTSDVAILYNLFAISIAALLDKFFTFIKVYLLVQLK